MPDRSDRRHLAAALRRGAIWLLGLSLSPVASALAGQDAPAAPSPGKRDFLFSRPRGWVAVRGGVVIPDAAGDLFTFVTDQLTVDKKDFRAPAFVSEAGVSITSRLDVSGGVEFSRQSTTSEYRRFVDNVGLPINQATELTQTNIMGSIRFALLDRGRAISRYAFVPRSFVPYVGAGAGALYYKFEQIGDFVDFVTLRVFPDAFRSNGWTPSAHVFGGADIRVWRTLFITAEGRYVWAHSGLDTDFVGFEGITLDGFRFSTGLHFVF